MHHLQHGVGGGSHFQQAVSRGVWGKARRHAGEIVEASKHNPFWTQQTNKARCKKQRGTEDVSVGVVGGGHHRPSANAKCCLLLLRGAGAMGRAAVVVGVAVSAGRQ